MTKKAVLTTGLLTVLIAISAFLFYNVEADGKLDKKNYVQSTTPTLFFHGDVLNIYGDYKNGSDGSVLNASSRSLKYLVADNAKSYQEKKITGKLAQHSQLHENQEVDKILIQFLWGK